MQERSHIVSNSEEGVEEALKFAVKNYKQKINKTANMNIKMTELLAK